MSIFTHSKVFYLTITLFISLSACFHLEIVNAVLVPKFTIVKNVETEVKDIQKNNNSVNSNKVPRYKGKLSATSATFNSFMKKNIGRTVYVQIEFDDENGRVNEPIGYRDLNADPFFEVSDNASRNYDTPSTFTTYFINCSGCGAGWRKTMNYDNTRKQLSGRFQLLRQKKINTRWTSIDMKYLGQ